MKTTVTIDDGVRRRLEAEAARQGRTLSEIVELAVRLYLELLPSSRPDLPPLPVHRSGGMLVDITDRDALYRGMEEH